MTGLRGRVPEHPSLTGHKWFHRAHRREQVHLRLFCLPYAGGSPTAYDTWSHQLPDLVELVTLRLPGHGRRILEPSYSRWPELLDDVIRELTPFLDLPFAFFGHSFGARLAYELTRRLEETAGPLPLHVFLSGCRCPHQPHRQPLLHQLPSDQFQARVIADNEYLAKLVNIEELIELMEPMLRAEIRMAERWGGDDKPPLNVPLSAFSGRDDDIATPQKMTDWTSFTRKGFTSATFPGGHFFVHSCEESLLQRIADELSPYLQFLAQRARESGEGTPRR